MNRKLLLTGITILSIGLYNCGGSSGIDRSIIIKSNIAFLASDSLDNDLFPPRGVIIDKSTDNSTISEHSFLNSNDTISVDKQAQPIKIVKPIYPSEARKNSIEGVVWLRMWITKEGIVKKIKIEESPDIIFNESALQAGMSCTFKNAIKDNRPIDVSVFLPYTYKLNK